MGRVKEAMIEQEQEQTTALQVPGKTIPEIAAAPPNPILALVERASRDNTVDVAKLRELIAMANEERARMAEQAYEGAMREVQKEVESVRKDAENTHTKSKYATYKALDDAVRPTYVEHGFNLQFDTEDVDKPDTVRVVCHIGHEAGHKVKRRVDIPAPGKGAQGRDVMTATHAYGSALTYGRRYLLSMIFNISTMDDDDGNAAGAKPKKTTIADAPKVTKAQPHEIPRPAGIKAVDWGRAYVEQIKLAETSEELTAWWTANKGALKDMEKMAPQVYERIVAVEEERKEQLKKGGSYDTR